MHNRFGKIMHDRRGNGRTGRAAGPPLIALRSVSESYEICIPTRAQSFWRNLQPSKENSTMPFSVFRPEDKIRGEGSHEGANNLSVSKGENNVSNNTPYRRVFFQLCGRRSLKFLNKKDILLLCMSHHRGLGNLHTLPQPRSSPEKGDSCTKMQGFRESW